MLLYYTERFRRSYADAPLRVQKQCDKQLGLLAQDLRHPSLRAKKFDEARDIAGPRECKLALLLQDRRKFILPTGYYSAP